MWKPFAIQKYSPRSSADAASPSPFRWCNGQAPSCTPRSCPGPCSRTKPRSNRRPTSSNRQRARDEAAAKDVTINGLPILAFEPDLDMYFRDYVIGGPGAFMIVAKDFESFGEAILRKMIIEIASDDRQPPGLVRPTRTARLPGTKH